MSASLRKALFLAAAATLAVALLLAVAGLPEFGSFEAAYSRLIAELAPSRGRVANAVTAVVFDYRALDTLIEEFVLFTAVAGAALLLRERESEKEQRPDDDLPGRQAPETSHAVRVAGLALTGLAALYGVFVVAHGHLSPGGGFQGGAVFASALLLLYLATDYEALQGVTSTRLLEAAEAGGAGGYVLIGLFPLLQGAAMLQNVLPAGRRGALLSGGVIPLASLAVGIAVASGVVLLLQDFLEQTLLLREGRTRR